MTSRLSTELNHNKARNLTANSANVDSSSAEDSSAIYVPIFPHRFSGPRLTGQALSVVEDEANVVPEGVKGKKPDICHGREYMRAFIVPALTHSRGDTG